MGQALRVVFENGVFRPLEPVDLDEHQELTITVLETAEPSTANGEDEQPLWEMVEDLMRDVPDEAFETLPSDGATEHDHYLYGTPKRG